MTAPDTLAIVAEWLRRWTRNPLGFPRAGSNPANCEDFFENVAHNYIQCLTGMWKRFQKLSRPWVGSNHQPFG